MTSPQGPHWGATKAEWIHFRSIPGLQSELLPVVCDPSKPIAEKSSLSSIGKVPSHYGDRGEVWGYRDWTEKRTEPQEVDGWMYEPTYGICIQSRSIRGIDVDVDDPDLAQHIRESAELILGPMPVRIRSNAPRVLLGFRLLSDEKFPKRRFKFNNEGDDVVEILGDGQQFVAAGTHTSGVRYAWEDGLPEDFPVITQDEFEQWWALLHATYPAGTSRIDSVSSHKGDDLELDDPVASFLRDHGLALQDDGRRIAVQCPNHAEHTKGADGDGSTAWMVAGKKGHETGHFVCKHGHCGDIKRAQFIQHLQDVHGYVHVEPSDFQAMVVSAGTTASQNATVSVSAQATVGVLPALERDNQGRPLSTLSNCAAMLRAAGHGIEIALDTFKDEIVLRRVGTAQWRTLVDEDQIRMREVLESSPYRFHSIGRELMRDAVRLVAIDNQFDSAREWALSLHWDGVPRVETFLIDYWSAADTEYTRAVARYIWTGQAGRALDPGLKTDMSVIFDGPQGVGKSTGVQAISPTEDGFTEISFHEKDDDLARRMRGKFVTEISELRGLHSSDEERIKGFMTKTHEHWIPKYKEFATSYPRRNLFYGTTNHGEFLSDDTGNRRWLPVSVKAVDVPGIQEARDQLWAEAVVRYQLGGLDYQDAERLAREVHGDYMISDTWMDPIEKWLQSYWDPYGAAPIEADFVTTNDVLEFALGIDPAKANAGHQRHCGAVLTKLGFERKTQRIGEDKKPKKVWRPAGVTDRYRLLPMGDAVIGNRDPLAL